MSTVISLILLKAWQTLSKWSPPHTKVLEAWQSCWQWFPQSNSKPDSLYQSDLPPKYWKPDNHADSDFPNPTQSLTVFIKVIPPKVLEAWQSCWQWFNQSNSKPDSLYQSDLSQSTGSLTILLTVISQILLKAWQSLSQWSPPKVLEAWQSCWQWFPQSYSKPDSLYQSDLSQSTGSLTIMLTVISPILLKAWQSLSKWSLPKCWKPNNFVDSDFPNPTQGLVNCLSGLLDWNLLRTLVNSDFPISYSKPDDHSL
jgi:predicted transcriptional regulator YdeE